MNFAPLFYTLYKSCKINPLTFPESYVLGIWHEDLPTALWAFRKENLAILLSQSNDAEQWKGTIKKLGYDIVRGSDSRGSSNTRHLLRALRKGQKIGMALDGPRGPAKTVKPGTHWLATQGKVPMIHLQVDYSKCWQLNTWDQMKIPKPFSRISLKITEIETSAFEKNASILHFPSSKLCP